MSFEVKAPSVGESITEVRIGQWKRQTGEAVKSGEVLLEIESDKATVEVVADGAGVLQILKESGETVPVGATIGQIKEGTATISTPSPTAAANDLSRGAGAVSGGPAMPLSPAVRKAVADMGINPEQVPGTGKGGRLTKGDVLNYQETLNPNPIVGTHSPAQPPAPASVTVPEVSVTGATSTRERRVPMSLLRQKIAERLVFAQHNAAILTTFNECDMTNVMALRTQHKDSFKAKTGLGLSFMSFFTRAVCEALKEVPAVNAFIEGKDVVYHDYQDVGVAVGTDRGLVVPVLRDAGSMGFVEIERGIGALAAKARDGKLSIKEMQGGTFTISNGGTYGSLLSTPILNPPQSGILGMHKIQERPMVVNGQVLARPMMYLALSYDHRIIDGKEAVTFLIKVKEGIENPEKLGFSY